MRVRMFLGLAIAALLTIVLVACGGSGDSAAPTEPEVSDAGAAEGAIPGRTEEQLSGMVLTLDDMPSGWTPSPVGVSSQQDTKYFCGARLEGSPPPTAQASVSFQSNNRELVAQVLEAYPDGQGQEAMARIVDAALTCTGWTDLDVTGAAVDYFSEPVAFPALGDETVAYNAFSDTGIRDRVTIDGVVTLRGDVLSLIIHAIVGPYNLDSAQTEELARLADQKVKGGQ